MSTIKKTENAIYDPLSSFSFYTENLPDIENIKMWSKEINICYGIDESFSSSRKTLIKNLEDNWEDRENVEFVLMDINSKDGFRKWIREQDLSKYTKSGYLRYYETNALDMAFEYRQKYCNPSSIRKNVVTLDCDNFTGYWW